jgi:hypothetical protein
MNETQLTAKVKRTIKRKFPHAWVYKTSDRFTSGIPDLIICMHGLFFAFEMKVGKNKATPIQQHTLDQIRAAGSNAIVAYAVEDVIAILDDADKAIREASAHLFPGSDNG